MHVTRKFFFNFFLIFIFLFLSSNTAMGANIKFSVDVSPQAAIDADPSFTLRHRYNYDNPSKPLEPSKSIEVGQTVRLTEHTLWELIVPDIQGCTAPFTSQWFWAWESNVTIPIAYTCAGITYYRDFDGDGYGDPLNSTVALAQPAGYVTNSDDCYDNDDTKYLGELWYKDTDGDGYSDGTAQNACSRPPSHNLASELQGLTNDCNDNDASIYPGATEICNDGIVQNCGGSDDCGTPFYLDADQDGYGDSGTVQYAVSQPTGYVDNDDDCNDNNIKEYPGQTWYKDNDGDGYSDGVSATLCLRPAKYKISSELSATSGDCDDDDGGRHPGAVEICEDEIDQDCDGTDKTCETDGDSDGTPALLDCNDAVDSIHPGAVEIPDDGIDQDCNGSDATAATCIDLADTPLDTQLAASAPNLMFGLDDSGSMDWEIMTSEEAGLFEVSGRDYEYIFQDPGDNLYQTGTYSHTLYGEGKQTYWRSQWHEYNVIYYNPDIDYEPWSDALGNADPDTPRSHPYYDDNHFSLSGLFFTLDGYNIPNAHYFVWSNIKNKPYLVTVDGTIKYYKVNTTSARIDSGDLSLDNSPPSDVISSREYTAERQNFANWYSYYRKRRSTSIAAIGRVLPKLQGVMVGFRSINAHILQKVLPVGVNGENRTSELLTKLFSYHPGSHTIGSTPARQGLQKIGQYYHVGETIKPDEPELSVSPLSSEASGECQQNFAILFTDGAYNGLSPGLGNVDDDMGQPYEDDASNALADVAMKYWKEDLAPDVDNNVPTNSFDNANWQHMVTYTVAFGVEGNLDPDDYDLDNIVVADRVYPTWPSPINSDKKRIDDLWHTAINGRGLYLNAKTPQELIAAFEKVVSDVLARIGSGASVSINGEELQEGLILYQSIYSTSQWTGDVIAYDVDPNNGSINKAAPKWSASEVLDAAINSNLNYWDTGRVIATYDNSTSAPEGIPFRYSSLSTSQTAVLTNDQLEYIRGNHALEKQKGGTLRSRYLEDDSGHYLRDTVLADIVHSAPLYFKDMIYVGGNDGMLHAFDSITGQERFAYIPDLVFSDLDNLTDINYSHQYYVDMTPFAKFTGTQDLLIGGLGKGGKGYYCLDVTNAKTAITTESQLAGKVMWEYPNSTTDTDEIADIGYSYSKAFIVNTYSSYGWVAIFGNGYNSPNHDAVLFIVDVDTGKLIRTIKTQADYACNGMATPLVIDVNSDDKADYVYAGDLLGNLWKFDLTSTDPQDWDVAYKDGSTPKPLFQAKDDYGNPQPITTKPDAMFHCDSRQHGYIIAFGTGKYLGNSDIKITNQQTLYAVWDYGDDSDNSEYLGSFNRNNTIKLSNQPQSVGLLEQKVEFSGVVNGSTYRILTDNEIIWKTEDDGDTPPTGTAIYGNPSSTESNHVGWYFDLPEDKERIVRDMVIRGGKVVLITSIPQSSSPCIAGGESYLMEVNACNGGRTASAQLDIDDDGDIDENDLIQILNGNGDSESLPPSGIKYPTMMYTPMIIDNPEDSTELKYFSTSAGNVIIMTEKDDGPGVYYWRHRD